MDREKNAISTGIQNVNSTNKKIVRYIQHRVTNSVYCKNVASESLKTFFSSSFTCFLQQQFIFISLLHYYMGDYNSSTQRRDHHY